MKNNFPSTVPNNRKTILPENRVYFLIKENSLSADTRYTLTIDTLYLPS